MVLGTFWSMSKWAFSGLRGVRRLAMMVCALFSSTQNKQARVSFHKPHGMGSIRKEKIGFQKTVPRRPFAREGGGASKAIWAMPIYIDHISRRGFPHRFVFSFHSLFKVLSKGEIKILHINQTSLQWRWCGFGAFPSKLLLPCIPSSLHRCPVLLQENLPILSLHSSYVAQGITNCCRTLCEGEHAWAGDCLTIGLAFLSSHR